MPHDFQFHVFVVVVPEKAIPVKHNVSLSYEADSVIRSTAHVEVISGIYFWESFPDDGVSARSGHHSELILIVDEHLCERHIASLFDNLSFVNNRP